MKYKRFLFYALYIILLCAGAVCALCYCASGKTQSEAFTSSEGFLALIMVVLALVLTAIEFISYFKIDNSTQHTVFIAAALTLYYATSRDVLQFFGYYMPLLNIGVTDVFNFLFMVLTALSIIYFLNNQYNLKFKGWHALTVCALSAVCICLYAVLENYNLQYVAFFIFFAVAAPLVIAALLRAAKAGTDDNTFYISTAILSCVFGMGAVDTLSKSGIFYCGTLGYPLVYMTAILMLFASIYILFIIQTERSARVAGEYKLLYERAKFNALCGQIKPHFVFNALSTIKALYRINPDRGDEAIDTFSRHLRANVEAAVKDLIPFEKELDYTEVYIKLENLKREKPLDIVYDIDFTDFCVPILSLQPYIENAIKYAKLDERENGFIKISSREEKAGAILEITDNGTGFDITKIRANGYGISNSRTRFELLLGIKPEIISSPEEGTTVRVFIPREKFKIPNKSEDKKQ